VNGSECFDASKAMKKYEGKGKGCSEQEVAKLFANFRLQVEPEAARLLLSECNGNLREIVQFLAEKHQNSIVISASDVHDFLKMLKKSKVSDVSSFELERAVEGKEGIAEGEYIGESLLAVKPEVQSAVRVLKSFVNERPNKDFMPIFRDRYERLSGILRKRLRSIQISALKNIMRRNGEGEEFAVIGIVADIRKTARGNTIVELEDASGEISVLIPGDEEIVEDEVIGVSGRISKDMLIAERVFRPDVPFSSSARASEEERMEYAVFISDIHAGSKMFEYECWNAFLDWLREHSSLITAVVVAGDIVDGIGVYPEQENDLAVKDVEEQYKIVASSLKRLPFSLPVILSPGNHDAVRNAEPQPPLPANIQRLFPSNTIFVSNPAYISIGNRTILIYHGQSYDDFIGAIPRLRYEKPAEVMEEMLKRRHLAPIYGKNVPLFPLSYDYGVIEPVPDILHCGHTHTVGVSQYRGVLLVNSGAWQSQTSYQKKRGIMPMPCCATLVELRSLRAKVLSFSFS